jgi:hypothetical protein
VLTELPDILAGLGVLAQNLGRWSRELRHGVRSMFSERGDGSYETLSLSLHLRIEDTAGERAELERRQDVRFTALEAGIIRDVAWGEGDALKGYVVSGATLLGVRREGPKSVLLLSLPNSPARGERAAIRCTRLVRNALRRQDEYLEVQVERPTQRVRLKVSFPKRRPPKRAWLGVTPQSEPAKSLPIRLGPDGHAFLAWRRVKPRMWSTYRLCWTW